MTQRPVVLVTGAARRVGRAIAEHLAASGYDVAVHYHASQELAQQSVDACRAVGARAEHFDADLSESSASGPLVERVVATFGRLDALVNSAAVMVSTPLDTVTPEQWDRIFAINSRAPFFLSLAAARVMREGGSIVNIGDHLAEDAAPSLVPHGVSKAAVIGMTKLLAVQLAPKIRVNAVTPGAVLPPVDWPPAARERFIRETPLQRIGTPQDVAGAIAYLLQATYVTGHILNVDGGRHVR